MLFNKKTTAAAIAIFALLVACSNNNVQNNETENDTNMVDTRRYTDTTSNYLTDDSAGINLTPAQEGTGLDQ